MKTLLIVEDEKMIRQGIAVMAKRCNVEIENIIECRNGAEALKVLEENPIDVMFTDIRMPKMDGIDLVKRTGNLASSPKIVVISGYDDFNYAVEMLKHGVQDYILKPVKREKIEEILQKLDSQIEEERRNAGIDKKTFSRQFLYYLQNTSLPDAEEEAVCWKFRQYMAQEPYYMAAACKTKETERWTLKMDLEGGSVMLFREREWEKIKQETDIHKNMGISQRHVSFAESREAFREALEARTHAFLCNLPYYSGAAAKTGEEIPKDFAAHFVQQFPTERLDESVTSFCNLFFQARHGKVREEDMIHTAYTLQQELENYYGKLLPEEKKSVFAREHPLCWESADAYLEDFKRWIKQARSSFDEEYGGNQNRSKIMSAVRYIEENFRNDINMAMVSNYVSMNYSLFSIAFKEYTGVNFVNYLKNLRIEEAKRLLEATDEKIQDIGRSAGFENDKNFLKSFRTACGVSPSEYRRNMALSVMDKNRNENGK